jgi:DNA-binding GntR family transcriptional regulator
MERIDTPKRGQQVYVSIRDSICEGRLEAGTHLVQESLAERALACLDSRCSRR